MVGTYLLPEQGHRAPHLDEGGAGFLHHNELLRLHEVGDVAVVVHPPHTEPRAGPLAAQPGDDDGPGLPAAHVHGADLHTAHHDPQQPGGGVHPGPHVGKVEHSVPEESSVRLGWKSVMFLGRHGEVHGVVRAVAGPGEVGAAT